MCYDVLVGGLPQTVPSIFDPDRGWVSLWGDNNDGTVMQSTGLTDKNGIQIFEGDVVRGRVGSVLGVVKFGTYQVRQQTKHDRPDWNQGWYIESEKGVHSLEEQNWYFDKYLRPIRQNYLCVIGDIYRNPDLLPSSK
jgi:uncharacterized phage protein (TIGR01671 family)